MNKKSNSSESNGFKADPNWPYSPDDPDKNQRNKPNLDFDPSFKNSDTINKNHQ